MKVLFYADTVFGFGGVQRVLAVVAKGIAAKHDVTILTTDRPAGEDIYGYEGSGISFVHIAFDSPHDAQYWACKAVSGIYKTLKLKQHRAYERSFFLPRYRRKLVKAVNEGHYDVVVGVHAFFSLHLAAVRECLNAGTVIAWMHNSYEALFLKENPYLPQLHDFFFHEMGKVDEVVVLSHADEALFSKFITNVRAIYNPLTLTPRGRGGRSMKMLAVGRFSPRHKGFDILIRAFALFAQGNDEWTLEIVGEGDEEPLYRRMIAEARLEGRVRLSPFTKDIQSHYASAGIYILSSRWEGFGLVLVEAMAHGLPVISSDVPVAKELIDGRGVGVLFRNGDPADLAEKMAAMVRSDRKRMSDNAIDYAGTFSLDAVCRQWEEAFRKSQ